MFQRNKNKGKVNTVSSDLFIYLFYLFISYYFNFIWSVPVAYFLWRKTIILNRTNRNVWWEDVNSLRLVLHGKYTLKTWECWPPPYPGTLHPTPAPRVATGRAIGGTYCWRNIYYKTCFPHPPPPPPLSLSLSHTHTYRHKHAYHGHSFQ